MSRNPRGILEIAGRPTRRPFLRSARQSRTDAASSLQASSGIALHGDSLWPIDSLMMEDTGDCTH